MNNMQNFMNAYASFMQNPQQYLRGLNIPNNIPNNPDQIIQYLMDTGRVSQGLYNAATQYAGQINGRNLNRY